MRIFALLLALVLVCGGAAFAEEATVWASDGEAYYHSNAACRFGNFGVYDISPTELHTLAEALEGGQRACPGCASEWKPFFSGKFPEWKHETEPWNFGSFDTWLFHDWGDVPAALDALPELPTDFGGIFANACGGYTVMLVHPTEARVQELRELLGCDFWVIEATFSKAELLSLQETVGQLFGNEHFGIHQSGVMEDANRLSIGVDSPTEENIAAIAAALAELGCKDPRMYTIEYAPRATFF